MQHKVDHVQRLVYFDLCIKAYFVKHMNLRLVNSHSESMSKRKLRLMQNKRQVLIVCCFSVIYGIITKVPALSPVKVFYYCIQRNKH